MEVVVLWRLWFETAHRVEVNVIADKKVMLTKALWSDRRT